MKCGVMKMLLTKEELKIIKSILLFVEEEDFQIEERDRIPEIINKIRRMENYHG
jgi:hypothetical protein